MDLDQSSEQDVQSPYRKKQSALPLTRKAKVPAGEDLQLQHKHTVLQHQKNGHYELVDTEKSCSSQKQSKTNDTTVSSTSNIEPWSKCSRYQQHHLINQQQHHHHHHQQQFSIKQNSSSSGVYDHCIHKQNTRAHHKSLSNRILSLKRENKTTQTLSIVVGGFIVCWLPFFICYLITPFLPNRTINSTVSTILTWLGWFNSAMNPFIYAFYSVDFRAAFWRLTFRRFFQNSSKPPFSSNAISIKR